MSFYVEYKTKAGKGRPFGDHHRATIYNGFPDYDSIISTEATGEHIERVSNTQEERGKLLVLSELVRYFLWYFMLRGPSLSKG
jgi:hypothetical protein